MKQFDPIFFSPKPTKLDRRLYKGGSGGDGGAAARKAAEDARIEKAVSEINQIFGVSPAQKEVVDRAKFTHTTNTAANNQLQIGQNNGIAGQYLQQQQKPVTTFDQAGYDAAVKAADDKYAANADAKAKREALYSTIGTDQKNRLMTDLQKEFDVASRENSFTLARNGLAGGSRDIDSNRELFDRNQQGLLESSNKGVQATDTARAADDSTRAKLISSIHAGLTADSATQQAYEEMANNSRTARNDANNESMVGFFDALKQAQQQAQYLQAYQTGGVPQQFKSPYSTTGNASYGGTIRGK